MSALIIKIVGCLAMLADHIGIFKPIEHYIVLRAIGRIAFPIFAWNIGNGYSNTRNKMRYLLMLLGAGVISEIPFDLCQSGKVFNIGSCNVMFTLAFGLLAIILIDSMPTLIKSIRPCIAKAIGTIVFAVSFAFLADLIGADYGFCGVLLIVALWLARGRAPWIVVIILAFAFRQGLQPINYVAVLATSLILFYNGKSGLEGMPLSKRNIVKYAFYAFYPLHQIILYSLFK